jgi:hypothetical protein
MHSLDVLYVTLHEFVSEQSFTIQCVFNIVVWRPKAEIVKSE